VLYSKRQSDKENKPKASVTTDRKPPLSFAAQVADNPRVFGIKYSTAAMIAAGAQPEFIAYNISQTSALKCVVILRAGDPPQYNKPRSPKSGLNLSKTSRQGFFKGAIPKEVRFARLQDDREPLPHKANDAINLDLPPHHHNYQHTMPLDINMRDILRETSPEGDLEILGFDSLTGLLRLGYKEGRGPKPEAFHGQFVINLYNGRLSPQFFSREWDRPDHDPEWDPENQIISKPQSLAAIPESVYQRCFAHSFILGYTEEITLSPSTNEIKHAMVFANRPRTVQEFKAAMGEEQAYIVGIQSCRTMVEVFDTLKESLGESGANQVFLDVYDNAGSIIAGDWDGLALGHPRDLNPRFSQVFNTLAPGLQGLNDQEALLNLSDEYLAEMQARAKEAQAKGDALTGFQSIVLSIPSMMAMISDLTVAKAGCITPHEFVYQQVLNYAYRDKMNLYYGEKYNVEAVQRVMNHLLDLNSDRMSEELIILAKNLLKAELFPEGHVSEIMLNRLSEHVIGHLSLAMRRGDKTYLLPHLHHDVNVHDLYQHGFDMRNPYGSNLEGSWLLVNEDGSILYGNTQKQLIEVLLTGDLLERNRIDISHLADMSLGWGRVISRQIELMQTIPEKTLQKYHEFVGGLPQSSQSSTTLSSEEVTGSSEASCSYGTLPPSSSYQSSAPDLTLANYGTSSYNQLDRSQGAKQYQQNLKTTLAELRVMDNTAEDRSKQDDQSSEEGSCTLL
jgi:hypothetical protein